MAGHSTTRRFLGKTQKTHKKTRVAWWLWRLARRFLEIFRKHENIHSGTI